MSLIFYSGVHFGASLGVVELTVAIHHVFNAPYDQIVWDVGHQAYGHKILTGRKDKFHTNRVYKGLSGFPKRSESEYDTFGVGHASTSISAALGMATAANYRKEKEKNHIAIIGDGALTGGTYKKNGVNTLVMDGIITQRLIELVPKAGIKVIVAEKKGPLPRDPVGITMFTREDLA